MSFESAPNPIEEIMNHKHLQPFISKYENHIPGGPAEYLRKALEERPQDAPELLRVLTKGDADEFEEMQVRMFGRLDQWQQQGEHPELSPESTRLETN